MNTDDNVKITPPRTNKRSVPVIVGVITLAVGILIGLAVTKTRAGSSAPETVAMTPTNGLSSATNSSLSAAGPVEWNPFQEIRDLQTQMDQLFSQINARFSMGNRPNFSVVNPGYSFSLNVQDLKDRYEVHAYVPDTRTSDVNVSLQNNQTLKVEVSSKNTESSGQNKTAASVTSWGQYAQTIQLPSPVKADQMKVERKDHELLITLRKAAGSNH